MWNLLTVKQANFSQFGKFFKISRVEFSEIFSHFKRWLRFLRFQRCSELNQPSLSLTSVVIADSMMNNSKHLWFRANITGKQQTGKHPENSQKRCHFSNIDAEKTSNWKFKKNFQLVFLKKFKSLILWKSVFPFDSMSDNFSLEQKQWKYWNKLSK